MLCGLLGCLGLGGLAFHLVMRDDLGGFDRNNPRVNLTNLQKIRGAKTLAEYETVFGPGRSCRQPHVEGQFIFVTGVHWKEWRNGERAIYAAFTSDGSLRMSTPLYGAKNTTKGW